jgi:indolepyruvate ferredoxin oxidoreductase beta subunit
VRPGLPRRGAGAGRGAAMSAPGLVSVVLTGVADQPVLATARFLATAALHAGLDVSCSECPAPGRGEGGLTAFVRMGGEVRSPVVSEGGAQVLVAFEELEALRAAHFLASDGFVALNRHLRPTWRMRAGLEAAPAEVAAALQRRSLRVVGVRAEAMARRVGDPALLGFVLLGVVTHLLPVGEAALDAALAEGGLGAAEARRHALARGRRLFEALPGRIAAPRERAG